MSGTSADGIDVALVEFEQGLDRDTRSHHARAPQAARSSAAMRLLGHHAAAYPRKVRSAVLALMNSPGAPAAEFARLNVRLAELYADAVGRASRRFALRPSLVGCHGQTIYHQGEASPYLGARVATTWQTGDGSVLAVRLGVPVVCDFRPADMAAGGKGAPLVPFFDYRFFRDASVGRIALNLGGIANLTAIPAAAKSDDVIALDTGPGNMVVDALASALFDKPIDSGGSLAQRGRVNAALLRALLTHRFFRQAPPRTAGREEFGATYVAGLLRRSRGLKAHDVLATATALTAESVAQAIRSHVLTKRGRYREVVASGGGTRNRTLMAMLSGALAPLDLTLRTIDEFDVPSEAKEAMAFALLAYETWHGRPSNLPSATGAKRPAVLGKICY